MANLVQVIVDVPTMQTNQPYTYAVPKQLTDLVQPGMRVIVPFGAGKREVQGFVVGVIDESTYDGPLKPLAAVMDLAPVVNPELLQLSQWLANETYAFWISCLYTMLPNLLKGKTKRWVEVIDELSESDQAWLFGEANEVEFDELTHAVDKLERLIQLQRQGKIRFRYAVVDQARAKTVTAIQATQSFEKYEESLAELPKNATAQRQLLAYLQNLGDQVVTLKVAQEQSGLRPDIFRLGEQRGWLQKLQQEQYRDPMKDQVITPSQPLALNGEQQAAYDQIVPDIQQEQATVHLLQGVTGSGKTEVYLQLMAATLATGKSALLLVPEISLTPQIVGRVRSRFGEQVAVLHSGLSNGERYDEWRRIQAGEAKVVVGARSAVFAPLANLGLIIMDEEHESSYKQDESPRYHTSQVALWRGKYHQAPVILGSATPSLETRARAAAGVYKREVLAHRAAAKTLPQVEIVDMRPEVQRRGETNFSNQLLTALHARLQRGEQSILLLNRRGFSSFIMCRDCGYVLKCPNCDISLTMHLDTHAMKCHYCGHEEGIPQLCPQCQSRRIRYYGTGTEKVDYPDVTLVGVLNADTGLDLPDFRAGERTFDLLTQVSGRAGRADKLGEVIIQTFNPQNYVIKLAQQQDYERFFAQEMQLRKLAAYPPYYYTVRLMGSHPDEKVAAKAMFTIRQQLQTTLATDTQLLGPTPRSIARLKNRYYYQIMIKYRADARLHQELLTLMHQAQQQFDRQFQLSIDPEPQYFM